LRASPVEGAELTVAITSATVTLGPDATRADIMKAMDTHTVGKAVLVGRFKRPQ